MGKFDLPDHYKRTLSMLLQTAGEGCSSLYTVPIEGRDIRDDQIANEQDLGPHMRSLISIDFPAPEMEPESAHVASAVSVP